LKAKHLSMLLLLQNLKKIWK